MSENIQKIFRDSFAFQEAIGQQGTSERKLMGEYPETLMKANILCADGFSVPVAVNRENWGNTELPVPGQVEALHDKFHKVAGYEKCRGTFYSFNVGIFINSNFSLSESDRSKLECSAEPSKNRAT